VRTGAGDGVTRSSFGYRARPCITSAAFRLVLLPPEVPGCNVGASTICLLLPFSRPAENPPLLIADKQLGLVSWEEKEKSRVLVASLSNVCIPAKTQKIVTCSSVQSPVEPTLVSSL
jgi:hypothetical protein